MSRFKLVGISMSVCGGLLLLMSLLLLNTSAVKAQSYVNLWACLLEPGAAPFCQITGGEVFVSAEAVSGIGGSAVHDPGPSGSDNRYVVIVPPTNTVAITGTCTVVLTEDAGEGCAGCASQGHSDIDESAPSTSQNPSSFQLFSSGEQTQELVWRRVSGVLRDTFPSSYSDRTGFVYLEVQASADGGATDDAFTYSQADCVFTAIELSNGTVAIPAVPTPTPTATSPPTATPTPSSTPGGDEYIPFPWMTPTPWATVPAQPGEFSFDVGDTTCYFIVPGVLWDGSLGFWSTSFTIEWPWFEVCLERWILTARYWQWDFMEYVTPFVLGIAGFFVLNTLRRG